MHQRGSIRYWSVKTGLFVTCKKVAEFLDAYLGGELPRAQKWIFDAHVALCKNCRNYIAGYKRTVALSKGAMHEAPTPVPPELVEAILQARKE